MGGRGLRRRAVLGAGLAALLLPGAVRAAGDHRHGWGVHGMLLFGGAEGLYAYHLPLFRPPHDRQVVLSLRLAEGELDGQVRAALAGRALWTLEPEKFGLDRLTPGHGEPLRAFRGTLVRGHFEQGGTRVAEVGVEVLGVEMFRPLDPAPRVSATASYTVLGTGRERFLVKQVDSRPDFDHVVALRASAGEPGGGGVTLPKAGLAEPAADLLAQAVRDQLGAGWQVLGTAYFATADLA